LLRVNNWNDKQSEWIQVISYSAKLLWELNCCMLVVLNMQMPVIGKKKWNTQIIKVNNLNGTKRAEFSIKMQLKVSHESESVYGVFYMFSNCRQFFRLIKESTDWLKWFLYGECKFFCSVDVSRFPTCTLKNKLNFVLYISVSAGSQWDQNVVILCSV
jgi:hypothetical protein